MVLKHDPRPDVAATCSPAPTSKRPTAPAANIVGYQPLFSAIGILRDGKLVSLLERRDIEARSPEMIVAELIRAFGQVCSRGIA
jgi:putative YphP/YqiW family bacilliredoxin